MRLKSVRAAAAQESASLKNPAIVLRALARAASPYFNLQGSVLAVAGLGWNLILSTLPAHHVPAAAGHSTGIGRFLEDTPSSVAMEVDRFRKRGAGIRVRSR